MSRLSQYRIGILEDDPMIAETLMDILETLGHQVLFAVDNGEALLHEAGAQEVELLLLDIQVKGDIDGIQTAAKLPESTTIPYVFTTAFADTETLERVKQTAPYGYVIKPYGIKDIEVAIQIAMLNHKRSAEEPEVYPESNEHLFVKENGRLVKIRFDELQYVEAKGDYMSLKCTGQQHVIYTSLKKLLERLPQDHFLQVHRSFVIQVEQIDSLEENSISIGTKHIPVSKRYMPDLLKRLNLL